MTSRYICCGLLIADVIFPQRLPFTMCSVSYETHIKRAKKSIAEINATHTNKTRNR